MNIILIEANELSGNRIVLEDRRAKHIVKVLRSQVGERVRVGIIDGMKGFATVVDLHIKQPYHVELEADLTEPPLARPAIDLIVALPRPIMLQRILSQAAALGVGTVSLINGNRVEKSFWGATILEEKNYRYHLLQGLEQAGDTLVPHVEFYNKFRPFVEDVVALRRADYSHCIVAHPGGSKTFSQAIVQSPGRILLAIGPEGGWVDFEVEKFQEQGFAVCSVGARILKVDTAVIALHSRLSGIIENFS